MAYLSYKTLEEGASVRQLYIAWIGFQRRQLSMQAYWGYELLFLPIKSRYQALKLLEYSLHFVRTLRLLIKSKPDIIWAQLPQVPLFSAALFYKKCFSPNTKLVADCHNGMFRLPWSQWPFAFSQINSADVVLVHNETMVDTAKGMGITDKLIQVLEDAPASIEKCDVTNMSYHRPWLIFPSSFGEDEPIKELFEAASLVPELTFVITGNPDRAKGLHDLCTKPNNVHLTGFLPTTEFNKLLLSADAVIGLTRFDGVQLSVCNEALGAGKPMILSDTALLRKLFYQGSIFVSPFNPGAIADGCLKAVSELERLSIESRELARVRTSSWLKMQADPIAKILGIKK
jgi:glycosyltransferase involved in cell wall biosynthesis